MYNFKCLVLTLLCLFLLPVAANNCQIPDKGILNTIIKISGDDSSGSAVIVARNRIITAAHVIEELDSIHVEINGSVVDANVILVYPEKDFAILEADTGDIEFAHVVADNLAINSTYWAIGYPLGGSQVSNPGRFSQYIDGQIHTTASVNFGQSGGGLFFCQNGRLSLAGMVTGFAAIDRGDHYERLDNHSIALAMNEVALIIERNK